MIHLLRDICVPNAEQMIILAYLIIFDTHTSLRPDVPQAVKTANKQLWDYCITRWVLDQILFSTVGYREHKLTLVQKTAPEGLVWLALLNVF